MKLTESTILEHSVVEAVFTTGRRDLYLIIPTPKDLDIRMTGDYWAHPERRLVCASVAISYRNGCLQLDVKSTFKGYIEGITIQDGRLYMTSDNFSHYETVDWGKLIASDCELDNKTNALRKAEEHVNNIREDIAVLSARQRAFLARVNTPTEDK